MFGDPPHVDGADAAHDPRGGVLDSALVTEIVRDEHGRPEPPVAADEIATLLGFLDFQRATFAWRT
ncbi:MAG TPA: hypothetical protein VJ870_10630 [Amycolatopsis sp.]|nr:hypothetical protein [Amycolatopsis sp.]